MKLKLRGLSLLLFIFITHFSQASKLSAGFEALEIYDYFKAKKLFYKAYKKDPAAASYGLSVIYGRNDNPFYNLDSSRKYILNADSLFPDLVIKKVLKYQELGVSDSIIDSWKDSVALKAYNKVTKILGLEHLNAFISDYSFSKLKGKAIIARDSLVFEKVKEKNTSKDFRGFIEEYPRSYLRIEARNKYNELLFREIDDRSPFGDIYKAFINSHPKNPYVGQAQDSIYSKYTRSKSLVNYKRFIADHPNNRNVSHAWRSLYKMYTASNSPSSIIDFRIDFPDYPYKEELGQDYIRNTQLFFPYKHGQLWGYKNIKGEIMIQAQYEFAAEFYEGIALVLKNDKVGYINKRNETIIPFEFDDGEDFNSGVVTVYKDDFAGLRDQLNQVILPEEYDYIGIAGDEMLLVSKDGKYGYYGLDGKKVIDSEFTQANNFENGIAVVQSDSLFGAINNKGDTIIAFKYTFLESFNDQGIARAKQKEYFGLVDKNGSKLIEFEYDAISELKQQYIVLVKGEKYGFAKSDGSLITAIKYDYESGILQSSEFKNAFAKVWQKSKVGIVDTAGNKLMPAIFQDIKQYDTKELIAVKKRGKWGYSNQSLQLIIPYDFEDAYTFRNGTGLVKKEDQWFTIDKDANIQPATFDSIELKDGYYIIKKGGLIGLMSLDYKILTSSIYSSYRPYKKDWIQLINGTDVHYFNLSTFDLIKFE